MKTKIIYLVILFITCVILSSAWALDRSATIIEVEGTVEVKAAKQNWVPAKVDMVLNAGDVIRTMDNSLAVLKLNGIETATVEVKKNSQMRIAELGVNKDNKSQTTMLDLALGDILIKAQKLHSEKSKFEVKTPTSIVGVRGTTFSVSVEAVQ